MKSFLLFNKVLHHRLTPKKYKFYFKFFWFAMDLDEINILCKKHWCISRNRFNFLSFYDVDYIYQHGFTVKENILHYLKQQGIHQEVKSILLITNLRILGYVFNPVSFYICETQSDMSFLVIQINNTFKEIKPYYLKSKISNIFRGSVIKNFYISPFSELNTEMVFYFKVSKSRINISVNVKSKNKTFLITSLKGKKKEITNLQLYLAYFLYPFITLQIIFFIHFHALILFLLKIPFKKKGDNQHLQTNKYKWRP